MPSDPSLPDDAALRGLLEAAPLKKRPPNTQAEVAAMNELQRLAPELAAEVLRLRAENERLREAFRVMEDECWSLHCEEYPTGAGDADIGWEVHSYHMTPPTTRIEAQDKDPMAALLTAAGPHLARRERTVAVIRAALAPDATGQGEEGA